MIKALMEKLQEDTGQTFAADDGTYRIPINDSLYITVIDKPQGFILESSLGEPPTRNEAEFYSNAMEGVLYGQTTSGAIINQSLDGRTINLHYEGADLADFRRFRQIIEDFWDAAVVWQEEIQRANS